MTVTLPDTDDKFRLANAVYKALGGSDLAWRAFLAALRADDARAGVQKVLEGSATVKWEART